jgi:hypothetical protein
MPMMLAQRLITDFVRTAAKTARRFSLATPFRRFCRRSFAAAAAFADLRHARGRLHADADAIAAAHAGYFACRHYCCPTFSPLLPHHMRLRQYDFSADSHIDTGRQRRRHVSRLYGASEAAMRAAPMVTRMRLRCHFAFSC